MGNKVNIEDLLRNKLRTQPNAPVDDWAAFESKLQTALWRQRAKSFASLAVFTLALFVGYNTLFTASEPVAPEAVLANQEQLEVLDLGEVWITQSPDAATPEKVVEQVELVEVKSSSVPTPKAVAASTPTAPQLSLQATPDLVEPVQQATSGSASYRSGEKPMGNSIAELGLHDQEQLAQIPMRGLATQELYTKSQSSFDASNPQRFSLGRNRNSSLARPSLIKPLAELPPVEQDIYISPLQEKNPWSINLNVYPNFTFRTFKVDDKKVEQLHMDFIDAIESSESGGFSLNVGLGISKRIGPVAYLTTGAEYITYNTVASFNFQNFRDANIDPSTGEILSYRIKDNPKQVSFNDRNSYHYVNFPVSLSYKPWASTHIRLNLEAGGSAMYFLGAQGQTIDYKTLDIMDLSERDYRNWLGSFFVKVGANYFVNEKINFGFEPTLLYFTNTIYTQDMPFYVIPYSVGMNLHMQVKLN